MRKTWLALGMICMSAVALAFVWTQPVLLAPAMAPTVLSPDEEILNEYFVSGNPESLVVEAPGRIWFTSPPQNLIGRLVVTSTVDYSVMTYTVPTTNSYPYDIDWAGGAVWFTQRDGNKIGRLDPDTGIITEYPLISNDSSPTGIDVLVGNPTQVWFVARDGDSLGTLVYTDTVDFEMQEVPLPAQYAGAQLQDVSVKNAGEIWFTAPGKHSIARYLPGTSDPFDFQLVRVNGIDGTPWSIDATKPGVGAWFTDRGLNSIGFYYPTTVTNYFWYDLRTDESGPNDLVVKGQTVWCTAEFSERVIRVTTQPSGIDEYQIGNGALGGIDADAQGHIWFAERDAGAIGEWRPPYFRNVYLPLIVRFRS
jgi:virginiamycin B lyase